MSAPRIHALALGAALLGAFWPSLSSAAPITITNPFIQYENKANNSLGFAPGPLLRFGANSVIPNGANGTVGVGTTTNTSNGALVTRSLGFDTSPASPNFFSRTIPINSDLLGPWTLTFTNGTDVSQTTVALVAGAAVAPFVNSVTLSGSSSAPTFTWTPPPNTTVNGYRINIFDKSLQGPGNSGNILSRNLQPNVTSYTAAVGDFTVAGYALQLNRNYSIEISLIQTNDGMSSNLTNANASSISRVYADFTLNNSGGQVVNLPVVLPNGAYQFNMSVVAGQTYYIDPLVAVGYDYEIGLGDPNFQSVILPVGIGDGLYDIFGYDASGNLFQLADNWAGGAAFDFGAGGLNRFRVTDIEASASLDPANTTAFVTGLTFAGSGQFTGTQTPITVESSVLEPPMLALVAIAVAGLGLRRRARVAAA